MTIAIYGLGVIALVLATIGIWRRRLKRRADLDKAIQAYEEYWQARMATEEIVWRIRDAEKRHRKRAHLYQEYMQAKAQELRLEGRLP